MRQANQPIVLSSCDCQLLRRAETGEQWAIISELEAAYVEMTGHQIPVSAE